jgi:hypothetical protein
VSLLSGIVADARTAVDSQIDALRHEVDDRVAVMGASLLRMAIALGISIVAALLCALAIVGSLVALGVSPWVALWCVAILAAGLAVGACVRASAKTDRSAPAASAPPAK